ncbi:hypothetical protein CEXT_674721 [Caerostris extrusa]|uniref:Uncharacterized protein n=1 Tax=Caerostris extrusa TaxID=172846 RepID=A0AAV4R9N3_CAEEX|nr:hypothetical protein CEXT_674721 [Caerostris extrusa]
METSRGQNQNESTLYHLTTLKAYDEAKIYTSVLWHILNVTLTKYSNVIISAMRIVCFIQQLLILEEDLLAALPMENISESVSNNIPVDYTVSSILAAPNDLLPSN